MGNCLRRNPSRMVWAGEDWGSVAASKHSRHGRVMDESTGYDDDNGDANGGHCIDVEKESLLLSSSSSQPPSIREVKIKITKKELQELVRRVEIQGLSLEQVLENLMAANGGDGGGYSGHDRHQLQHQCSWRPALQSIPEGC